MRQILRARHATLPSGGEYDVFLLGAGFSRAIDSGMPLTRELTGRILDRVAHVFDPESIKSIPFLDNDFEKGLSYLAVGQPWLLEPERLRNRALFLDLSDAIHYALVEAQDEVLQKHPECPSWLLALALKMHLNEAVVISLNYDTLLEMAAAELCFGENDLYLSTYLRPFDFPAREGHLYAPKPRKRFHFGWSTPMAKLLSTTNKHYRHGTA